VPHPTTATASECCPLLERVRILWQPPSGKEGLQLVCGHTLCSCGLFSLPSPSSGLCLRSRYYDDPAHAHEMRSYLLGFPLRPPPGDCEFCFAPGTPKDPAHAKELEEGVDLGKFIAGGRRLQPADAAGTWCWTVLYCTVLYCTVLYCTVLYCTVLYCTVHCSVGFMFIYCTLLYCDAACTVLYSAIQYSIVLYVLAALYCTELYSTVQCCKYLLFSSRSVLPSPCALGVPQVRWSLHLDLTTDSTQFRAYIYSAPTLVDLDGDGVAGDRGGHLRGVHLRALRRR